ncbi:TPA: hypothetical protein ACJIK4_002716 [Kluyvera cryocrescens]
MTPYIAQKEVRELAANREFILYKLIDFADGIDWSLANPALNHFCFCVLGGVYINDVNVYRQQNCQKMFLQCINARLVSRRVAR